MDSVNVPAQASRLPGVERITAIPEHGIRVNQQYRITFRWEKHHAHDVCCADCH
jgi:hypothetical protein